MKQSEVKELAGRLFAEAAHKYVDRNDPHQQVTLIKHYVNKGLKENNCNYTLEYELHAKDAGKIDAVFYLQKRVCNIGALYSQKLQGI